MRSNLERKLWFCFLPMLPLLPSPHTLSKLIKVQDFLTESNQTSTQKSEIPIYEYLVLMHNFMFMYSVIDNYTCSVSLFVDGHVIT